ncbi:MAG: lipase maturation factor family protein [Deltaproteobacteria bacterium]
MTKPVFVYDGDCDFCRVWIERWRELTGEAVDYRPYQQAAADFPHIPAEDFVRAAHLVEPDGSVSEGAEAVFKALALVEGRGWLLKLYALPGFARAASAVYRAVSSHRRTASLLTSLLWGKRVKRPRYSLVRWVFLKGMGVVYAVAFLSLWVQVHGLIGSRGILPVGPWLESVGMQQATVWRFVKVPTLLWLGSGDTALHLLCAAGLLSSLALAGGLLPRLGALGAWLCYLSLFTAGRVFLSFQWDILLLEAGFLALLFAPGRLRPGVFGGRPPSAAVVWLLRWLLFRLMFLSGAVKLLSGDAAWSDLTALGFHWQTQPLPVATSWYLHQLPGWSQQVLCAGVFVVELIVPFFVFAPRRLRLLACGIFLFFQALIVATGNYAFFNLLTVVLCICLLDDDWLGHMLPKRMAGVASKPPVAARCFTAAAAFAALVSLLVVTSGAQFAGRLGTPLPPALRGLVSALAPLRLTNSYGLFSVMSRKRPEIIVEGSMDGKTWQAYEFKWKPGDLQGRPRIVAPHQPRLDWQMWFAALGSYHRNPWFVSFVGRLLEGSPQVLGLLANDPFDGRPPRYARAVVYDYSFSSPGDDAWWRRVPLRLYMPVMQRPD